MTEDKDDVSGTLDSNNNNFSGDNNIQRQECQILESCTEISIRTCVKCNRRYCQKHSSRQNLTFCLDCYAESSVEDKNLRQVSEFYSRKLNATVKKVQTYRQISFNGEAWRNSVNLIRTLSDKELVEAIEIHRGTVILMEQEILQRMIKAAHDASTKAKVEKPNPRIVKIATTTKEPKEKTPKKIEPASSIGNFQKILKKQGISLASVEKLLKNRVVQHKEKQNETNMEIDMETKEKETQ